MKQPFESRDEALNRENVYYWMNKYITLLEKYNDLLLQYSANIPGEREKSEAQQAPLKK